MQKLNTTEKVVTSLLGIVLAIVLIGAIALLFGWVTGLVMAQFGVVQPWWVWALAWMLVGHLGRAFSGRK